MVLYIYSYRSKLDISDETIRIQNFHFSPNLRWKNCWKLPKLIRSKELSNSATLSLFIFQSSLMGLLSPQTANLACFYGWMIWLVFMDGWISCFWFSCKFYKLALAQETSPSRHHDFQTRYPLKSTLHFQTKTTLHHGNMVPGSYKGAI